jgi:FAD/FMN-containing dehydrogenase
LTSTPPTGPSACSPASPISAFHRRRLAEGFFYAPDPSSQLACTIAGNIAMNSGGAHCLKYGVTTNNVLGVTLVLIDGTIVEIGGAHLDAPGYDLLGLIVGSEGQLGIVTEATLRILRWPRARARCCSASNQREAPAPAWPLSSARASSRSRSNSWTSRRSRSARLLPMPAIRWMSRPADHRGRGL